MENRSKRSEFHAEKPSPIERIVRDSGDVRDEHRGKVGWLAPITLEPPRKKIRERATIRRASCKDWLSMTLSQFLRLFDWTGRQIRRDKSPNHSERLRSNS